MNRLNVHRIKFAWLRRLVIVLAAPLAWCLIAVIFIDASMKEAALGAWEEACYNRKYLQAFSGAVKEAWRCDDLKEKP
ncbi:hypothetical protein [Desulfocurvibacter africanus]|uniref:Uncharacterized protein n=1 Tax=Desulfocurvibacter africanus subsp. africanus str. Walvis Bay TaxID=690850 RepID=F3YW16_DESAF|nr:hypothetical protein [Desulfocurvibacter africanus]EGJ49046.1 hypothetical protein Desaf_0694 [Desulfocurvibacter africanus subsp. africanus str. Walvis Bay]